MLSARLCLAGLSRGKLLAKTVSPGGGMSCLRNMASEARSGFARHAERRRTLKEVAMAPTKGTPFNVGMGAVAGGAVVGLGALCFYGLGLSSEAGAVDRSVAWPDYVRHRIRDTYAYFGASIGVSAATAAAIFRSPAAMAVVSRGGLVALGVSLVALIGSGAVARSIPYQEGLGSKQLAWLTHCAVLGAVVAPIALLGGQILVRAAWYTAGMVGGLSAVAACAPSDKFLTMGGPLALGLGVVFAASVGSHFLPPTSALGAGMFSVALYGGLLLFGGFLLYDTQKIIHNAEAHPQYSNVKYDPINNSIGIYLDTVNIFIRIAQILAMSGAGGRRK